MYTTTRELGPKISYYRRNFGSQFPNGCICGPSGSYLHYSASTTVGFASLTLHGVMENTIKTTIILGLYWGYIRITEKQI